MAWEQQILFEDTQQFTVLVFFYIIFENLHDKYSCNFSKVHLVAMVNSLDLKTYGFDTILTKITEDIKILETSGVSVEIKGKGTMQIFGSISQFCGDSLATNEIFGLVENFSTTDNCCSICYGTIQERSAHFLESSFLLRNREFHQDDLDMLTSDDRLLHVRGVKKNSVLNDLKYFHTSENRNIDSMHLLPEGILPLETGNILHEFVTVRKVMSLLDLNRKIRWVFACLKVDKGNTPAELNNIKPPGKGLSPKLTASEMLSLFRYLPVILGPFIPMGDRHWALFLQLQTLVDIAYAPSLTDTMLDYFEELYEDHMLLYKKLYPEIPVKPKQHFLVHFKTIVKENGPMRHLSCLKYELRNGFFKRLSHVVCNFKNISKTLTTRNQYTALAHSIIGDNIRDEFHFFCQPKQTLLKSVESFETVAQKLNLPLTTTVGICKHINRFGVTYSTGNIVVVSKENFELQFGEIKAVICCNNLRCVLLVAKLDTVGFNSHLHVFQVNRPITTKYICMDFTELFDYHPCDLHYSISDGNFYVRLKYQLISNPSFKD
jgi:hypothetical protein